MSSVISVAAVGGIIDAMNGVLEERNSRGLSTCCPAHTEANEGAAFG